jgi:two-component system sensor histidine kinase PilS (NtrC family)
VEIEVRFHMIEGEKKLGKAIYLEDISQIAYRAQQLKLASLGRLSAGVAHEIRNPLTAISHAAELLQESSTLSHEDARLIEIIHQQTERMNIVIKNVLQLSQKNNVRSEKIDLKIWLPQFIQEFDFDAARNITFSICNNPSLIIEFDVTHLQQILTNLCENGLRASREASGTESVKIIVDIDPFLSYVLIDIIDVGPGVPEDKIPELFEPFFTTKVTGTGLGLYLAKALCECNNAQLSYFYKQGQGACFRVRKIR